MPRARWLKPEFFTDRKIGALGPVPAVVYQALWVVADDGGMAMCDPDQLKGEVFFRWDSIGIPDIEGALCKLHAAGRIAFYQGGDELFCQIQKWSAHQHVHKPSKFRYRSQYEAHGKELREVVPDWCGTCPGLVTESSHPRLPDTQPPSSLENQLLGASRRAQRNGAHRQDASSPITVRDLLHLVAEHLYAPDSAPPCGWDFAREGSVIKSLLKRHQAREVAIAIEGITVLRDYPGVYADRVDWLEKGAKVTTRVLRRKSGLRAVFDLACEAYWRFQNRRSALAPNAGLERVGAAVQRALERLQ